RMIKELYELFEKKAGIIMNKVPIEIMSSEEEKTAFSERLNDLHDLPIIDVIPCFCDVLRAGGTYIFTKEKPEHPFTKSLEKIAARIEKI
ncbi:MAG: hypothetical protein JSV57_02245, partial [Candidatus Bathyarchaeota archaeon]